ncbi:DNA-3-methyladenine glycosylase family protein [Youxingia wuxianensis]|uniref:DNA-(apurinic or apyrimidinic site) lyase n=1 Tax=Youxingia wuxianensis TaxID=2763678 RepID=A0A926IJ63_9FIRM|nr:DNA-3-methyladenine glycosylase [Youxingia wuxianensis]MBC8586363.1 DNA-3-methyladenine glycosylase 2 family protein [Youxingia wuxianensis]
MTPTLQKKQPVSTHCGIMLENIPDFDLDQTLNCGQCFRWDRQPDGSYIGISQNHSCHISQKGSTFYFEGTTLEEYENFWKDYFDLTRDYGKIKSLLSQNPVLRSACAYAPGIRVLRQEPWEALCSFIISQNNNVGRIKGIVARLCETFGDPLDGGYFSFPGPERLAELTPQDLAPLRCGFRARYIIDAAQKVASGQVDLESLKVLPLPQAREVLTAITGVGNKVADCALLYGCGRIECFPVDVWIKRAMERLFPKGLPKYMLPWAGIAQQYIFHYVRTCPGSLEG